jgi:hypothetical protein
MALSLATIYFWWLKRTMKLPKISSKNAQKRPKVEPSTFIGGSNGLKIAQKILTKGHKLGHQIFLVAQWDHETTQKNLK